MVSEKPGISLSDFFPKGTVYFYGYPSGEESGFLNLVNPETEEVVAARVNYCAGDSVKAVNFSSTARAIDKLLLEKLGLNTLSPDQLIVAPEEITADVSGAPRNALVKQFLKDAVPKGSLVMAQPFVDEDLKDIYQIDPAVTAWLNDKKNMGDYASNSLLPQRYGKFLGGKELLENAGNMPVPAVIKVTSSSAGDGVYICKTKEKLLQTAQILSRFPATITVEQYIDAQKNYGLQFGIASGSGEIQIIGVSEQITTAEGEFLGGIIESDEIPKELSFVVGELTDKILPYARKLGWYGIGCFDVLVDNSGQPFLIDANFRMTGMSAFLFMYKNSAVKTSLLSFGGKFTGDADELEEALAPLVESHEIKIVSLSRNGNTWRFNGCVFFDNLTAILETIKRLHAAKVETNIFNEDNLGSFFQRFEYENRLA